MALFLSTFVNKIDNKGRISIPASFRTALAGQEFQGIVLFRSHSYKCLEGFGWDAMTEMCERLDHYAMFSAEQDDLATVIFGEAVQLVFDGDGRIVLPRELALFAGIKERAAFVGLGRKFQVWEPETFDRRREAARSTIHTRHLTLPKEQKD